MSAVSNKTSPWWINGVFVVLTHIAAVIGMAVYRPQWQTVVMSVVLWQLSSIGMLGGACSIVWIGVTMGYHRLWSHRTFEGTFGLRVVLAILGTMGFQGSIKWWVQRHRLHHRYTDTEDDPYNAKRGFWFSHIGWIFEKPFYPKLKTVDISDLLRDQIVVFQHKYYVPLAVLFGLVVPVCLGRLWGDSAGGLIYGGLVTRLLTWHGTFCINSFAHMVGSQDYSIDKTARGNFLLALITVGEGYHNFHHEFPKDYRNGVHWYDYDPTKWFILLSSLLGVAGKLWFASAEDIQRARILTAQTKIDMAKAELEWGPQDGDLPVYSLDEFRRKAQAGSQWILIDGSIYDVSDYAAVHPGGPKIMSAFVGRDASQAFNGGLNFHSSTARAKANMFRVGKLA